MKINKRLCVIFFGCVFFSGVAFCMKEKNQPSKIEFITKSYGNFYEKYWIHIAENKKESAKLIIIDRLCKKIKEVNCRGIIKKIVFNSSNPMLSIELDDKTEFEVDLFRGKKKNWEMSYFSPTFEEEKDYEETLCGVKYQGGELVYKKLVYDPGKKYSYCTVGESKLLLVKDNEINEFGIIKENLSGGIYCYEAGKIEISANPINKFVDLKDCISKNCITLPVYTKIKYKSGSGFFNEYYLHCISSKTGKYFAAEVKKENCIVVFNKNKKVVEKIDIPYNDKASVNLKEFNFSEDGRSVRLIFTNRQIFVCPIDENKETLKKNINFNVPKNIPKKRKKKKSSSRSKVFSSQNHFGSMSQPVINNYNYYNYNPMFGSENNFSQQNVPKFPYYGNFSNAPKAVGLLHNFNNKQPVSFGRDKEKTKKKKVINYEKISDAQKSFDFDDVDLFEKTKTKKKKDKASKPKSGYSLGDGFVRGDGSCDDPFCLDSDDEDTKNVKKKRGRGDKFKNSYEDQPDKKKIKR